LTVKRSAKISTFDGAGFWKNAYAHQRGKLLRAVQVPDDQIKILVDKKYPVSLVITGLPVAHLK